MIYQPHQIALWPRLLDAARIDQVLQEALKDLTESGASLTLTQTGALRLAPGDMSPAAYDRVKLDKLSPRAPKMATVMEKARTMPHPWVQAVQAAHQDLLQRISKGSAALTAAIQRRDPIAHSSIAPVLLDRHIQANAVASALLDAGYARYIDHTSAHVAAYTDLLEALRAAGQPFAPNRSWPIDTPDGRIWVTDDRGVVPQPIDTGSSVWTPQPDEPVLTSWELAQAIATIDTSLEQRKLVS